MTEVDVYHLSYYNKGTKTKGIVVYDTKDKAEKEMKLLSEWELYVCMEVTGPHKHKVEK